MIIFVNTGGNNAGDKYCCPNRYYFDNSKFLQIRGFKGHTEKNNGNIYIIGGGGILNTSYSYNKMYKGLNMFHKYILWGAGVNKVIPENIGHKLVPNCKDPQMDNLEKFTLIGRRDYGDFVGEYVPCVSCKLEGLQKKYTIKRKIGVVKHMSQHRIGSLESESLSMLLGAKHGAPSIDHLLEFIGSSEIIVTSAYHGMYWATLMGKRVIIQQPCSNKFLYFKYKPIVYSGNLEEDIEKTQTYPNSLQECIELNDKFYDKVLNIL